LPEVLSRRVARRCSMHRSEDRRLAVPPPGVEHALRP
jgi:hypothetical protein